MKFSLRFTKVLLFVLALLLCLPTTAFADTTESSYRLYVTTPKYFYGYETTERSISAENSDYAYLYFYGAGNYSMGPSFGSRIFGFAKTPEFLFKSSNAIIYTSTNYSTDDVAITVNGYDTIAMPWFPLAEGTNYFNVHVEKATGAEDFTFLLTTPTSSAWQNPFADVATTSNYYNGVAYCNQKSLINGTSSTTFSPDSLATRAMVVTILYRIEGAPAVSSTNPFNDIKESDWYYNSVLWASQNGIVNGYDNGSFGANDNITREQLAAILYRYAFQKIDTCYYTPLDIVQDAGEIASYAVDAVKNAIGNGILNIQYNKVNPDGSVTRGDLANAMAALDQNVLTVNKSMFTEYPTSIPNGNPAPTEGKWITGETFGTDSWSGNANNDTYDKAWDNNEYTFFDPTSGATEDCYTGIKTDKKYILTEIRILPREGWLNRFNGAAIQGSNDGKKWTTIWSSGGAASSWNYQIISAADLKNNNGYKMFRYVNLADHGDVAEIELYGYAQD